jgi:malate dehydrogenase (oxaloacetate-decarboxylating)
VVAENRGDLNAPKKELLVEIKKKAGQYEKFTGTLQEALVGRDIFIGVSKGNLLKAEDIKTMNTKPIVIAMANPTPEIMPDEAKRGGAFIVGTGRSDFPNQLNNILAFPGIFRGALDNKIGQFDDKMFVSVAEKLAKTVAKPAVDKMVPDPFDKRVMPAVASAFKAKKDKK